MLTRAGTSLVELLVALVLAGLVLAVATGSLLRQQRGARTVGARTAAESQSRHVARVALDELAPLAADAADIVAGQATDTTLELRAVVASGVTCDSATTTVALVPAASLAPPLSGFAAAPVPGDSLWLYPSDSAGWLPRSVAAVARAATGCARPAAPSGSTYRLTVGASADAAGGTPVRLTRHERLVFYRASDGRWYFGLRDWSASAGRFLAPQPVAGPLARTSPASVRTGFRYLDSLGAFVVPDGTNERDVARVRVTAVVVVAAGTADSLRVDSADVALAHRGAS